MASAGHHSLDGSRHYCAPAIRATNNNNDSTPPMAASLRQMITILPIMFFCHNIYLHLRILFPSDDPSSSTSNLSTSVVATISMVAHVPVVMIDAVYFLTTTVAKLLVQLPPHLGPVTMISLTSVLLMISSTCFPAISNPHINYLMPPVAAYNNIFWPTNVPFFKSDICSRRMN